jgi:chromosome segregation ATPase
MAEARQNNKWLIPIGICIFLTLFGIQEYRLRSIETKIVLLTASMERGSVEEKYSTARTENLEEAVYQLRQDVRDLQGRLNKIDSNIETILQQLRRMDENKG